MTFAAIHSTGEYPDLPAMPADFFWTYLEMSAPVAAIELLDIVHNLEDPT